MRKKIAKWAYFLAVLLAVGLYARPMTLSQALPVEGGQVSDFLLEIPYTEPIGDTGGQWVKEQVYQFKQDTASATTQALLEELKTIRCRRSLNFFAGKPTHSTRDGCVTVTWLADGERCDFMMAAYKKTARIYRDRYYVAYVLEEGAYNRIAAVLQTYGALREE